MEKHNLTEGQLRNLVFNTIKDTLISEGVNELSPELLRNAGNKALAKGREGFGKYEKSNELPKGSYHYRKFKQGDNMIGRANELEKSMTESELRDKIFESLKDVLSNFADKAYMAHVPSNKEIPNPTPEDVIQQDGWIIKNNLGNGRYEIHQKTGAFANTEGTLSLDELIEDLNKEYFKGQNRAKILKRNYQFGEYQYSQAEDAIIEIK